MKTMKNFTTQQLTKGQMNAVKGGKKQFECFVDGQWIPAIFEADSLEDAEAEVRRLYGSGSCSPYNG